MPVIKVKRKDILRKKDILYLLKNADSRMRCLIALSWAFGKRVSENLLLQREEIFVEKEHLNVRFHVLKKRKNKDATYLKTITVKHPAVPFILEYAKDIGEGPLFPGFTRQLALYYLKKLNKDTYLHLFRKSLATEMSEHSFTVQQLMSWFDWSEPKIAMEYVSRGPGLTKELSEREW